MSQEYTFGDLFQLYIEQYAMHHCKSWKEMLYLYKNHLSCWKEREALGIKRFEVVQWHASLKAKVSLYTANRAQQLMRSVFNRAIDWELLPSNYNPAAKIRKFHEKQRERFLQEEELGRFFAALGKLRYDVTRDFFLMLLLTGARKTNVLTMQWSEIDFARAVWRIPETKNGGSQYLPLTGEALALLKKRKKKSTCQWVFESSYSKGKPLVDPVRAWRALLKEAQLPDLRLHDLRRSVGSWLAITNASLPIIAKTLGHNDFQSTAVYARLTVEPVRDALATATNAMFKAGGLALPKDESSEQWITLKEAAALTGLSEGTLRQNRYHGKGPPSSKVNGSVRYNAATLKSWMAGRSCP